jgi:hypothetical protein
VIEILDKVGTTLHVLVIAGGTWLYLQLLGFGLTRLLLRHRLISYQVWLAPWFGLMLAVIPLFWLSRSGVSTQHTFYVITILGVLLAALSLVRIKPAALWTKKFDGWLAAGALATLAIALYPMHSVANAPTTISVGNNDPALYAVASDYLKLHSVARLPALNPLHPDTILIAELLSPGHRPGAFLVLSMFDCLFRAPSYRVFSVVFAVFLGLTTPLVAIFAHLVTGKRYCGRVALALTVANINFIYCYYEGFAAQVLILGCIIAAFILVLADEREKSPPNSHSIAIGFAIIAMILLVPEGALFFILPWVAYAAIQAVSGGHSPRQSVVRYGPAIAVAVGIGMIPMWEGAVWLYRISAIPFGWVIPHWSFPVHMVGLMSPLGTREHSILMTGAGSLVVAAAMFLGIARSRNRLFLAVVIGCNIIVLFYFGVIRHYSYAYYKATVMGGFAYIAAFSAGLPIKLYRRLAVTCAVLALFSLFICRPTIHNMTPPTMTVTAALSGLSQIPLSIARGQVVSVDKLQMWDRLWAPQFMPDVAVSSHDPFFSPQTPTLILRSRGLRDGKTPPQSSPDVLWANDGYLLTRASRPR